MMMYCRTGTHYMSNSSQRDVCRFLFATNTGTSVEVASFATSTNILLLLLIVVVAVALVVAALFLFVVYALLLPPPPSTAVFYRRLLPPLSTVVVHRLHIIINHHHWRLFNYYSFCLYSIVFRFILGSVLVFVFLFDIENENEISYWDSYLLLTWN